MKFADDRLGYLAEDAESSNALEEEIEQIEDAAVDFGYGEESFDFLLPAKQKLYEMHNFEEMQAESYYDEYRERRSDPPADRDVDDILGSLLD